MLRRKWEVRVRHILKSLNGVMDHMAKYVDTGDSLIHLFIVPSDLVRSLLDKNHHGSRSFNL